MRFSTIILLFLLVSTILISCKREEEGSISIHFKALYDGEPLQTFVTKPYDLGQQIDFSTMTALISDLRLFDGAAEIELDEVELVNMSFNNLQDASEGYTITINNLPVGAYDGIRFGMGLPPDLNQRKPADFPSSNPMSNTGYYWEAWDSYIFTKTEGRIDTLGTGTLDLNFAFHTGSDDLYRLLNGPIPIAIEDGKVTEVNIFIDYKDLIEGIDIKENPQNHNPADTVQIGRIVTNMISAITLSL